MARPTRPAGSRPGFPVPSVHHSIRFRPAYKLTCNLRHAAEAVFASPGDTAPRLRFADAVENSGVGCPYNHALTHARAAFIRAQVAANLAVEHCPRCRAVDPRELGNPKREPVVGRVACDCPAYANAVDAVRWSNCEVPGTTLGGAMMVLPLRVWIIGELPPMYLYDAECSQGFIDTVVTTLGEFVKNAGALFKHAPIKFVSFLDADPADARKSPTGWVGVDPADWPKREAGGRTYRDGVPVALSELAWELRDKPYAESHADSRLWLGWAAVEYGRAAAMLPKIPPDELTRRYFK